jgi:hypothetical protein
MPPIESTPTPLPVTPRDPALQAALDQDHLKLLEIGYYISGVTTAIRFIWFGFMAAMFFFIGLSTLFIPHQGDPRHDAPPAFIFILMAFIFSTVVVLTLIFAALEVYAGRCLRQREHPVLIQVIAAFYCISIPWGTALGVCTFMVLNRPSVRALFVK